MATSSLDRLVSLKFRCPRPTDPRQFPHSRGNNYYPTTGYDLGILPFPTDARRLSWGSFPSHARLLLLQRHGRDTRAIRFDIPSGGPIAFMANFGVWNCDTQDSCQSTRATHPTNLMIYSMDHPGQVVIVLITLM